MADEIRIYKHKDGSTTMVNVTAINELIHELAVEEAMQRYLVNKIDKNTYYQQRGYQLQLP